MRFFNQSKWRLMKRRLRFWGQRRMRGWDDSETWSLDVPIANFILPRLIRFREIRGGRPCDMTEKKWDAILGKMIDAFTLVADPKTSDEWRWSEEQTETVNTGLRLFGKYFGHLWW